MEPSKEIIEDLCVRFVLTAPSEQLTSFERMMFLVELAHWHYEDFVKYQDPRLRGYSLPEFTSLIFKTCSQLAPYLTHLESIIKAFNEYKRMIPVMGGILLDSSLERVLMVKGIKPGAKWGFPRGKINKTETDSQCAVREVFEETGFDIEKFLKEEDFLEVYADGKKNKLYIVTGVDPDTTVFAPQVRQEIGGFAWHRIADLPTTYEASKKVFLADNGAKHCFYGVWPFIAPLQRWIKNHKKKLQKNGVNGHAPGQATKTKPRPENGVRVQPRKEPKQGKVDSAVVAAQAVLISPHRTGLVSFKFDQKSILDSLNYSIVANC